MTFLDDTTLAYASGHGVVLHETDSGLQVRSAACWGLGAHGSVVVSKLRRRCI